MKKIQIESQKREIKWNEKTQTKYSTTNPLVKYANAQFFNSIINNIKKENPKKILDVGCGEGNLFGKLVKNYSKAKIIGIDYSAKSIKAAKKYGDARVGSIYSLKFKNKEFDLVTCFEVLEHLDNPRKALKELIRVGKIILITVPNDPIMRACNLIRGKYLETLGNFPDHVNHWTIISFKKFLQKQKNRTKIKHIGMGIWLMAIIKE